MAYTPEQQQRYDNARAANSGFSDTQIRGMVEAFSAPTTISNENKITKVPEMINKMGNLSQKGVISNPQTGTSVYSDGSAYTPQESVEADTTDEDAEFNTLLDTQKTTLDANTKILLDNIQQKFAQRRAEQKEINRRQEKGVQTALLMGGTTGRGSSAQFAPISSGGIVQAQESYGVKQIAELDSLENDAIAAAKAAQESGNFKILEKKLARVEEIRNAKIQAATKLNEEIAKQNEKMREQSLLQEKDNFTSEAYASGITDVAEIMKLAKEKGVNLTSKEVADSIKNIVPPGLDDLVKTLRTNGAPPEVVQKVLSSGNINKAYENAGNWGAGGAGIVGEYNLYKAQALQAGQVPMDFQAYQNVDANRKKSIAAAGVANEFGLDKEQRGRVYSLMDDYDKETKDIKTVISSSRQIDALANLALSTNTDKGSRAASQIGTIFSFMKMLDPSSTVREGEYATAQNTAGVTDKVRNAYNKAVDGSFLTDGQIKGYVSTAKALAQSRERNLEEINKEFDRRGELSGIPAGTIPRVVGESTSDSLVSNANQAKQSVDSYFDDAAPEVQKQITSFYKAGKDDMKIYEWLKLQGLI